MYYVSRIDSRDQLTFPWKQNWCTCTAKFTHQMPTHGFNPKLIRPLPNILQTYMLILHSGNNAVRGLQFIATFCMRTGARTAASSHCNTFQNIKIYFWSAWVKTKTLQSFLRYLQISMFSGCISPFISRLSELGWVIFLSTLQVWVTLGWERSSLISALPDSKQNFWEARTVSPNLSPAP